MGYRYQHLNESVREIMVQELDNEVANGEFTVSSWVKSEKKDLYQRILRDTLSKHSDTWLARHLETLHVLARRDLESGKRVAVNAATLLAESLFNQYYCRALCQIAIEQGIQVRVVRGRSDSRLGLDAVQILGRSYNPVEIYEGMRNQSALIQAIDLASAKKGLTLDLQTAGSFKA